MRESSSCLLNSMEWFPAGSFSFLPPLRGKLTQICQDGNQLQSGNQRDQAKKPDKETEVINPSGPQGCIASLTQAGIAQCRPCVSSSQKLKESLPGGAKLWIPSHRRWLEVNHPMTGQGHLGWVKANSPDCSRESGAGSQHKKDTALTQCPQASPRSQAAVHILKGKQGLGLLIVSVTSRSFLHLFSWLCAVTHVIYNPISFLGLSTKQKCHIFMLSGGNSASYFGLKHILASKPEIFDTWFVMAEFPTPWRLLIQSSRRNRPCEFFPQWTVAILYP